MYYAQKVYAVGVTHCKINFFKVRVDTGSLSKIRHYWTFGTPTTFSYS